MNAAEELARKLACKLLNIEALEEASWKAYEATCQGAVSPRLEIHSRYSRLVQPAFARLQRLCCEHRVFCHARYSKRSATRGSIRVARRAGR